MSLSAYVETVLGVCNVISATGTPERGEVLEVVDGDGSRWFAKRPPSDVQWRAEVRAYRRWVPAFQDQAPRLRAADKQLRVLVLSAVAGRRGDRFDADLHRRAGQLLLRIHQSRPARHEPRGAHAGMVGRMEAVLNTVEGLFSGEEAAFARAHTRLLGDLPPQPWVPCHGDYQPHNWLRDDDGVVRVVDFADSRWQQPAFDIARLYFGPWWGRPHLAEAFLDGYGRQLDDAECAFLNRHLATNAVVAIRWGHTHGVGHIEQRGRARLAELMAGHRVALHEPRVQTALRHLRRLRPH